MSTNHSKNKEKRRRSASVETSNSFVKNVTSAVSGLLPTTITKWFSSPRSSNTNGSTAAADATDSSTEDEAPESPTVAPPPPKRMRYNTSGQYEHYTDANCSVSNIPTSEPPYSPYSATPYPIRNTLASTLHTTADDTVKETTERKTTMFKSQHSMSSIGHSVANTRKSIFDTYSKEDSKRACAKTSSNTVRDPKQSCFKPSLLGSPFYPGPTMYGGAASSYINQPNIKQQKVAVVNESTNDNDSGMSTSARRIMELLEQYSSPLREAKRIPHYTRPSNNSLNTSIERQTPTRSLPYSYKSQELHVPSIASILRLKQKSRLMDTTNVARQIIASHSSTAVDYPPYPIATQKNEPEKEQDTKMTTKVKSRLTRMNRGNQDQLDIATPVKLPTATLSIDQDKLPKFNFGPPVSATSTPKSIFNSSENKKDTDIFTSKPETNDIKVLKFSNPVKVSCDIQENETTPPKYKFDSPECRIEQKADEKTDGFSVVVGNAKETEKTTNSYKWKCSECWVENKTDENKCVCCGAKSPSQIHSAAKCSKCKLTDSQPFKDKCVNCEKMQVNSMRSSFGAKSSGQSEWKCSDCWAPNKPESMKCACCGGKPPSNSVEKVKCSVCKLADSVPLKEKCVNCDKIQANNVASLFAMKSSDGLKWKCDECWVSNDCNAEKCISCGIVKPKKSEIASTHTTPTPATKCVESDWKCNDCWISNKSSVDKCAACGGAKPGAKQTLTPLSSGSPFYKTPDNSLKNIAKSQKLETWECSSCLVRNEANKSLCVCCGAERESKNKMPEKKFNFGSNTSFKFGIDPKIQETTLSKKPELETAVETKLKGESEKNNNVLAETPTFTFTLPTKKAEDKVDAVKPKVDEAPKMAFTFGIPKQAPVASKPSEPPKTVEEAKEKAQEVPKVHFGLPTSEAKSKPLGGLFSSSTPSLPTSNTAALSDLVNPNKVEEKKQPNVPSNQVTLGAQPAELAAKSAEKSALGGFTFGGSLKPPVNMFGVPATTATATSLFSSPTQTSTTTAPATFKPPETSTVNSLFQKPNTTASTNASLFQTETATTAATTAAPTGPVFSFGSNATNPKPASSADKPALSFTFGSNAAKTDASPFGSTAAPFKSMFASAGDNNVSNNNAFSLASGNTVSSGSTLTPNPIGGNGLTSTNGLPGTTMSAETGNPLGGTNGLASNPLGAGNSLQAGNVLSTSGSSGLFSSAGQKENVWSASSNQSSNLFVPSTTASAQPKPAAFTFGSSTPFNAGTTSAFGGTAQQPTQNMFGLNQSNNNQSTLFSSPAQSQPAPNIFGAAQPAAQSTPQMGMFGSPSVTATPTFGSPNPLLATFETPAASTPAFNFGAGQQSTNIFGFGLQQTPQQQTPPQQGLYSFGGAPAGGAVQFNIGSGPNTAMRRMRKAVRRNPPR